jgi:hypothetical protein
LRQTPSSASACSRRLDAGAGLLRYCSSVGLGGIRDERSLQPGESQVEREAGTRVCIGGIVCAQMLRGFGLSDAQVTEFFKKDTTITMNMTGQARFVEFASIIYGVRFVGD